jgi:hypothetical protein
VFKHGIEVMHVGGNGSTVFWIKELGNKQNVFVVVGNRMCPDTLDSILPMRCIFGDIIVALFVGEKVLDLATIKLRLDSLGTHLLNFVVFFWILHRSHSQIRMTKLNRQVEWQTRWVSQRCQRYLKLCCGAAGQGMEVLGGKFVGA